MIHKMNKKHFLSVGAIFKNESMIFREWLEHYLYHGVEHFYLINDNSNDDYLDILKPYMERNLITLFHNDLPKFRGRQKEAYNKYFQEIYNETYWLAILDLDEYLYSPVEIDIKKIIKNYEDYSQIVTNWAWFGSNGLKLQPKSIVQSFTKRAQYFFGQIADTPFGKQWSDTRGNKCILKTEKIKTIDVHGSEMTDDKTINLSWMDRNDEPLLIVNHYALLSEEYWFKIKATRGDVNCWHSDDARNRQYFELWDINDIEDLTLLEQNKHLL